jgi:hypothetical protein
MPSKTDFQKYLDTKKTDTRLTGHIERHLMKKAPGERSTTVLHPSEMIKADFCHRYSYYLLIQLTKEVHQRIILTFRCMILMQK